MYQASNQALRALALLTGLDRMLLESALAETSGYRIIRVPKRSGGTRIIHIPTETLKMVQQAILEMLYLWPTHRYMFGFQPGRSPIQNAQRHLRLCRQSGDDGKNGKEFRPLNLKVPQYVLRLDIKDAFPSVTSTLVRSVFDDLFESHTIDNCRPRNKYQIGLRDHCRQLADCMYKNDLIDLLVALTTTDGRLPQGVPSSPYLLNLTLCHTGLMNRLVNLCLRHKARVTLYADDITISTDWQVSQRWTKKVIAALEQPKAFVVNPQKIHLNYRRHGAHTITGVTLSEDEHGIGRVSISQNRLNQIRQILWMASVLLEAGQIPDPKLNGFSLNQALGYAAWIGDVYRGQNKTHPLVEKPLARFKAAFDALRTKNQEEEEREPEKNQVSPATLVSVQAVLVTLEGNQAKIEGLTEWGMKLFSRHFPRNSWE
ncbi:MAG: reverse transcriptase family protein [Candidatus Buchananbacteria bacterium]